MCLFLVVEAGDVRRFDDQDGGFMTFQFSTQTLHDIRVRSDFTVRVRPEYLTGLIIYIARQQRDFIVLGVRNGTVELRYDLGSGLGIIKSEKTLQLNTWHTIIVTRNGQNGKLFRIAMENSDYLCLFSQEI